MAGIFVSHSSVDKEFAIKLAFDLVNEGFSIWFDIHQIELGEDIQRKIKSGIDSSDQFIVMLSPDSVRSSWVARELVLALDANPEGDRHFSASFLVPQMVYQHLTDPGGVMTWDLKSLRVEAEQLNFRPYEPHEK